MSLKRKTISGLSWSFTERLVNQGSQFVIGIVLARLLLPKEFGLIGMVIIFSDIAAIFIDSGFSEALIRKNDCSDEDYNTVFYFNLVVSVFFYIILFFAAGYIAAFFNEPQLVKIVRVLGLSIIITSLGLIQITILIKEINFRLQTKITFISSIGAGLVSIFLAFMGFGVWALVWRAILLTLISTLLLWIWNNWRPKFSFSANAFREMFVFGSKLMASGIINKIYNNIYYIIIGKFFSADELGYYTRAKNFSTLPSSNLDSIIQRVSYPVLSELQDDKVKLKNAYKKLITNTMFVTFILMICLAATAKPLILTLIGPKWSPSIILLQLLCFAMLLYPLQSLNLNILKVEGRSDLFLKLEIIKKLFAMPVIFVGIYLGIKAMIIGMIILSFISYIINSYWSGKLINYSMKEQILDILPSFIFALIMGAIVFLIGIILSMGDIITLLIQLIVAILIVLGTSEILKFEPYFEIKEIILTKILKNKFNFNQ
jgi:teichuronic acid exporter